MTAKIEKLGQSVSPTHSTPPTGDIIDGAPAFTTWTLENNDGLRCGM